MNRRFPPGTDGANLGQREVWKLLRSSPSATCQFAHRDADWQKDLRGAKRTGHMAANEAPRVLLPF